MNQKNLEQASKLFGILLTGEEVRDGGEFTELYRAYYDNAEVGEAVDTMLKALHLHLYEYSDMIFVTAGEKNRIFGYSNEELKRMLGLRLNRELYLCYYLIFACMTHFYTDSATYTYAEYARIEDIIRLTDNMLARTVGSLNLLVRNEVEENSFRALCLLWDELPVIGNDETGVRAGRGSKAAYVKLVFNFLITQGLFAEAQERYYPKPRFHGMVRSYYEQERGRLYEISNQLAENAWEDDEDAAH